MSWQTIPVSEKYREIANKILDAVYQLAIAGDAPPLTKFPEMQFEADAKASGAYPTNAPETENDYIKYVDHVAGKWIDAKCAELLRAIMSRRETFYHKDGSQIEINGIEALLVSQCIREILYGPNAVAEISVYRPDYTQRDMSSMSSTAIQHPTDARDTIITG